MLSRVAFKTYASQNLRRFATESPKPSLRLVAELRKHTEVSIAKAREALVASNNDVPGAVAWLAQDLAASGEKKAAKVSDRVAKEGLISVSVLSPGHGGLANGTVRAAMVELNCETDFVGRNKLFSQLAADIAHTAAFVAEPSSSAELFQTCPLDLLNDAPLLSASGSFPNSLSVKDSILELVSKVGEKIALTRATTIVKDPLPNVPHLALRVAAHAHGLSSSQGRVGALSLLALKSPKIQNLAGDQSFLSDLHRLERAVARQIVGFETSQVKPQAGERDDTFLYNQAFMMMGESNTVESVLRGWGEEHGLHGPGESDSGVAVIDFKKWVLAEG